MGIIDDYLSGSSDQAVPPSKGSGLIEQYLNAPDTEKKGTITIRSIAPPISGDTAPLPQPDVTQAGGANPRDSALAEGVKNYPAFVGNSLKNNLMGGLNEIGSGITEKSPKDIGIGLLRTLTTIPATASDAVSKPITEITGSPDIGDRAGFIASAAVPVAPGLGLISKVPTSGTGVINSAIAARPSKSALKDLIENIGPENLPAVVKGMKDNSRLGPADLSPRVLQDTQNLFVNDGPQIDYLARTSANRMSTVKDTVSGAFDTAMGKTVNAADKVEQLKQAARDVGKKNIEPVLAAKPHTDVTSLIKHIDSEIGYPAMKAIKKGEPPPLPLTDYQRELLTVRNKLRNPAWPEVDKLGKPKHLFAYTDQIHDAQIALREKAQGLVQSPGIAANLGKELFGFREKMKDAIGPEYKEALGKYAGEKKIGEAFQYGHDKILANGKTLENDPSFFEKWVNSKDRKPGELDAAKEGARLAINAEIQGTRSAATNPASRGTNIGQVDFNRQRLTTLLGNEEANKLLTALDHARLEANTHNKIFEGSQTAMRTASKSQFTMPTKTEVMKSAPAVAASEASNFFMGGMPGAGTALLATAKVGAMAKDAIRNKLAREHNLQYAKLALPTEGPSRDALIKSLEAAIPGPKQSIVRRGAGALSRLVAP